MVNWLSANPIHAITFYVLTTVFAAFETVDPKSLGGQARMKLAYDREIMAGMTKALGPAVTWKDPGLRATVMLRWTLFLTEARHRDTSLENEPGFTAEELESQIWNAVQGGAFSYLALAVLQLQRQRGSAAVPMLPIGLSLSPEQEQFRELPDEEVKKIILHTFETLVRSLITYASSELRKIKQRQEDVVLASTRVDRTRTIRAGTPHISTPQPGPEAERLPSTPPRNDVAVLLSFIGLLYAALPPESALAFWGAIPVVPADSLWYWENMESTAAKLPPFLQWAVWTTQPRDVEMSTALYYMLSGLANGQQCSELTYNFLARGGTEVLPGSVPRSAASAYGAGSTVSWTAIFDLLESWASAGATRPAPAPQQQLAGYGMPNAWQHPPPPPNPPRPQHLELGPSEVTFAQSFLRLLATVVKHSVTVRLAITGNSHFRAIPTLVSLIPLGVPLELKGALFETLSAFCEPGAGPQGVDICKAVWASMERLEVINVRGGQAVGFGTPQALLSATKGVEVELAEVESVYKLYPATIPFLKLLSTLIHSPKRLRMKDRVVNNEPTNTVPEQLGQPYRLPGIGPFISFVLDTVFAKIPTREYLRPSDRWQMNDLCLSFVEQCLASYDLEALQALMESQQLSVDSLLPFLVHPGYDIMKRLLTGSPLLTSILSYIVEGVEGFEKHFTEQKHFAEQEPFFQSTIVRVLRIVFRVLEIQDVFLDVIIPALAEFDSAQIVGTVHSRSYFTKFDQALSFRPQFVPALASYVAYSAHSELVLLAIKITKVLSLSHAFQNLAAIIERSSESERILTGFRQVMDMESMEDVATAEALAENQTGAGAPDVEGPPLQFEQAIRLAALDLFIQDTDISRPYPDVGHFLLFGGVSKDLQIEDPHALGARRTCIHVILDLVNDGVPKGRGKADDQSLRRASSVEPLYLSLPAFAERCYKVIYQLCIHPKTSEFSMRYLRTHEDFFARQIAAIPATVPETLEEPYIEVLYSDATRVITTVSALSSFLRLRSWIQDLVALELHVLTERGHHKGVAELLEILFGNNSQYLEDPENSEDENLQDFRKVGQSPLRIIEFVQSLNFDWSDSLTVRHVELDFLKQVDLQACLRKDSTGCEIVDRTALLSLLNSARQFLHAQGRIVTQAHVEQLRDEMNYIRESCAVENHRRQVRFATAASFEAWRRLLDMTLAKCFQRLPHDRRENMLFDLLHVLPMAMRSPNVQDATAVLLSEAILSSVTKLREDRRHQIVVQSAGGDADAGSLPAERLYNLLRNILECILDNNHLELVRGNLYAALINYLHLVSSGDSGSDTRTRGSLSISLSSSTSRNGFMAGDSEVSSTFGQRTQSGASALEAGSLSIMKTVAERLVATISRDAIDGTEVWKTVAFMCLDSLVQLSRVEKQPSIISALVRHGLLSNFVTGLKESDARLQSVLKPEPGMVHSPTHVLVSLFKF
jgi:nuclear pore complex protein Nup205